MLHQPWHLEGKYRWEDEAISTYNDMQGTGVDTVLLRQAFVNANEIDISTEIIEFPWHGFSRTDFNLLDCKLQACIVEVESCQNMRDEISFIKRHREVYNAFFSSPICVFEKDNETGYIFSGNGRHRIYVAQINGSVLPVWVVEYIDISNLSLKEYINSYAAGGWRFFEKLNIDENKIRRFKELDSKDEMFPVATSWGSRAIAVNEETAKKQ